MTRRIDRRRFLAGLAAGLASLPVTLQFACSDTVMQDGVRSAAAQEAPQELPPDSASYMAEPEPPFILPEGEQWRMLMAGTPQETPLYVFGSGRPGNILMVLGGVHGNEPGGWHAADWLLDSLRPVDGGFLIIPRANRLADYAFVRTMPELGDLNRLYPGDPYGLPMARMAFEITETAKELHVTHVVDMHESWAFYNGRPQNGTAYLGQTIATDPSGPGMDLAKAVVESVNTRIWYPHEEMFYRERSGNANNPNPQTQGTSSLGLPRYVPGLSALLVEMGQQQGLDRRAALHVDVVYEVARRVGIIPV